MHLVFIQKNLYSALNNPDYFVLAFVAGKIRTGFFVEHCLTYDEGISDGSNDTYERMMIRQIISEEVQPYFLGQKDLDTICEIMQSRVNILLSERE